MGSYSFIIPGTDVILPRFELISEFSNPLGPQIYSLMELPLQLLAIIPWFDDVIFFQSEGVVTVRLFMIFLFWFLFSLLLFWIRFRHNFLCNE